jgi:hypothetical protein
MQSLSLKSKCWLEILSIFEGCNFVTGYAQCGSYYIGLHAVTKGMQNECTQTN